jgi:hypothetical protein
MNPGRRFALALACVRALPMQAADQQAAACVGEQWFFPHTKS